MIKVLITFLQWKLVGKSFVLPKCFKQKKLKNKNLIEANASKHPQALETKTLTGDFVVTVSDINSLFYFFLYKIYSETDI